MSEDKFQSLADIIKVKQTGKTIKPPAYPWQELALQVIKELGGVPNFKRASIFKVCRDLPENKIRLALNDTKELCQSGSSWKYFFKILEQKKDSTQNKKPKEEKKQK
ncbi:hypothetical protein GX917_01205 [Candidatus Falkowbacteria bacterium]|jgi:hypothetical protein|nr:hypothetical protein [Candidatus Falkowbacteria bacterium]